MPAGVRSEVRPIRQKLQPEGHALLTAFFDLRSWMEGKHQEGTRSSVAPCLSQRVDIRTRDYLGNAKLRLAALAEPVPPFVLKSANALSRSSAVSVSDCAAASTSSAWADISSTLADTS